MPVGAGRHRPRDGERNLHLAERRRQPPHPQMNGRSSHEKLVGTPGDVEDGRLHGTVPRIAQFGAAWAMAGQRFQLLRAAQ